MAIFSTHREVREVIQTMDCLFEILIPLIGECLGDRLDKKLSGLKALSNDQSQPEYKREAAKIITDILE